MSPAEGGNALGHPISLALNLHSNSGVDKCALRYREFARAVGVDASKNVSIPCDFGSEVWARALFDVYLDALPLGSGLDYPWPDCAFSCYHLTYAHSCKLTLLSTHSTK